MTALPRKPRLTAKVIRGLSEVENHAGATLQDMSDDETRDKRALDDMGTALEYLRDLRAWYRARHK